ncbi:hypothetical protein QTL97_09845 [Sporosarcina thermotolerans]|uniref:Uncharacterized protein n=1 Tax=Sporosarcina thermotolerans TaxID=633404 RepID=A0AAW9A788_9BACL|nr:hypothetical protein [Sporosarcina thermotolerans]MDW0117237.1 hypothetical protein [Sporosarcina thermotolerans]WHT47408.1 hypothetical protein QNH10_14565 [Sporosarcina thermotolerans]
MDHVEKEITKRNQIAKRNEMYEEVAHEFASLGEYRNAVLNVYKKTMQKQNEKDKPTL